MSLTKMTTDLNIIAPLNDETMTVAAVKAKFDEAGLDIQDYINNTMTTEVDAHTSDGTIHMTDAERVAWNAKQSALTFDTTPTANSTNPVTSGGIKTALDLKADAADLTSHTGNSDIHVTSAQKTVWTGKQDKLTFDTAPTAESINPVTSGGIKTALDKNDAALTAHTSDGTIHMTDAERAAWNAKQSALTFDITPTANSTNPVTSGGIKTVLDLKANAADLTAHTANTSNPHSVTAAQVGLDKCDNTADADKPVSTATQAALDLKADVANLTAHTGNSDIHVTAAQKTVWTGKQDKLTFDTAPTANSTNPVTSGGIKSVLDLKANAADLTAHTGNSTIHITSAERAAWSAGVNMPMRWQLIQSYTAAGSYNWTVPDIYGNGQDYEVGVFEIGGGQAGQSEFYHLRYIDSGRATTLGGNSGEPKSFETIVTPNTSITVVVGAGGIATAFSGKTYHSTKYCGVQGSGGSTSFKGVTALGGGSTKNGVYVGQIPDKLSPYTSDTVSTVCSNPSPYGGFPSRKYLGSENPKIESTICPYNREPDFINRFDETMILGGAGASSTSVRNTTTSIATFTQTGCTIGNLKAGDSVAQSALSSEDVPGITGGTATAYGSGGGAAAIAGCGLSGSICGGNGACGAVFIYARKRV